MVFRLYRMKDPPREVFRWSAHASGRAVVKPRDFEPGETIDAPSPYAAWKLLRTQGAPLRTGDALQDSCGTLLIAKYIGLEVAEWLVPEPKPLPSSESNPPAAAGTCGAEIVDARQ